MCGQIGPSGAKAKCLPADATRPFSDLISWFQNASEEATGEKTALWPGHLMRATA